MKKLVMFAVCMVLGFAAVSFAEEVVSADNVPSSVLNINVFSKSGDGANVRYTPYPGVEGSIVDADGVPVRSLKTDAKGSTQVQGLAVGDYRIALQDEAAGIYGEESFYLNLNSARSMQLDLVLSSEGLSRMPSNRSPNPNNTPNNNPQPNTPPQNPSQGQQQRGGGGWLALAGLGGLAGLAGLGGSPTPVSPVTPVIIVP